MTSHNNDDLTDVEFDFVRVTMLLPNRKSEPVAERSRLYRSSRYP
jgi:hypothetical protein